MFYFAAVLIFALSFILFKIFYDKQFPRFDKPEFTNELRFRDVTGYDRTEILFFSGKNRLKGHLYGESNTKGLVVIAHGLKSGSEEYLAETLFFTNRGWRVFTYDCTGSHESEGKGTRGLAQSVLDLDAALRFIEASESLNSLPVMLYGHSWGGFAVTAVLNFDHRVFASVSLAGYNSPMELMAERGKEMLGVLSFLLYPLGRLCQFVLFGKSARLTAVNGINRSGIPVMIVHGEEDKIISYTGAAIMAHKEQIKNPNTVFLTRNEADQNGHSDMHMTAHANRYRAQKDNELKALKDRFDGNVPREALKEFYDGLDRAKANELDLWFMGEVSDFYERSIPANTAPFMEVSAEVSE
jgi:pimeloyl-ACP methyl ester carboxylesterase